MINIFKKYSLRTKLILLYTVLLIFSVGVVSYYSYWNIWQLLINNKISHMRATAKPLIEHWLTTKGIIAPDSIKITPYNSLELSYDLTSRNATAVILNRKGEIIANGKRLPEEMEAPPVNCQYFNRAIYGMDEINYLSDVNGKRVLVFLIPIRSKPGNQKILGVIQITTSLSDINKILFHQGTKQIFAIVIILIVGVLFGYWLTRESLKDLQKLSITCQEISKGNFTQRVDVKNREDEIGKLGDSFNLMIDRLKALFNSQKRFVANAAHELLTPLTGLRGSLEVLLRGAQDDRETMNRLSKGMYKEVNHLIRLCDQLLGLSRLENAANINKKQIVLSDFTNQFKRKAKYMIQSHPLIIQEGPYIKLMADPDLLEQIFFNLLSNAIRYSNTGTAIAIAWKLIPDYVELRVADQGEGMSKETLPNVFEPFYRGKNRKYSYEKGTGLGLALTKSMVEAHGGSIRIESILGKGTTIYFTLPI
jgi:two-component system OmpR family sensor kinase